MGIVTSLNTKGLDLSGLGYYGTVPILAGTSAYYSVWDMVTAQWIVVFLMSFFEWMNIFFKTIKESLFSLTRDNSSDQWF